MRAQALGPNDELIEDFKIENGVNSAHILNAPSPAATSALAIGGTVSEMAAQHFSL